MCTVRVTLNYLRNRVLCENDLLADTEHDEKSKRRKRAERKIMQRWCRGYLLTGTISKKIHVGVCEVRSINIIIHP